MNKNNKKIKLKTKLFVLNVITFLAFSILPFTQANTALAAACDSRTITGTVIVNAPPVQAAFEYGTNSSAVSNGSGTRTAIQSFNIKGSFPMEQFISGLSENTTYFYRIVVNSSQGVVYGAVLNFTTPACQVINPPTVTISADNTNLQYNGSTTIRWNSSNAVSCSASGGANGWSGNRGLSGSFFTGNLTNTTTYNITCNGASGTTPASDSVTVNVNAQQICQDPNAINFGGPLPCRYAQNPTVNITADNVNLPFNGSTTIRWNSTNATSCSASGGANGWAGNKSTNGSFFTGNLTNTTTYNITCNGQSGTTPANDSVTVNVGTPQICQDPNATNFGGPLPCRYAQNPTVTLTADDFDLSYGGSTNVHWNSENATSCTASGGVNSWAGFKDLSGIFYTGNLTNTTTYIITCKNLAGKLASASIKINVGSQLAPIVSLFADKPNVAYNGFTNIRWNSENSTSCTATAGSNGWANPKGLSGIFYTGNLTSDTTYIITCKNASEQSASASETVSVGLQEIADPIVDIFADDSFIIHGGSTNIRWNSENATSCTGNGGSNGWTNSRSLSGIFYTGPLTITTTYNITCKNAAGKMVSGSVKVFVDGQIGSNPAVFMYADNTDLPSGGSTNIHWNSTSAVSCMGSAGSNGWIGPKSLSGIFYTGPLTTNTTFNITCSGSTGATASSSATILVVPTVTISANPAAVSLNGSSIVTWISKNATFCFADGGTNDWAGIRKTSGSFSTGPLTEATTFNISCSNSVGSDNDSIKITIKPKIIITTL